MARMGHSFPVRAPLSGGHNGITPGNVLTGTLYDEGMARDFDGYLSEHARELAQPATLTRGQLAVIFLLSHGMSYREIGDTLHLAESTCSSSAHKARRRLGARTVEHGVATALRLGLIS